MARRSGLTLLEVLAALVILGLCAAGWAALLGQGTHSVHASESRELEIESAAHQLSTVALWSNAELLGHTGRSRLGDVVLVVGQTTPTLFDVAVADTLTGRILLRTSFYRRD